MASSDRYFNRTVLKGRTAVAVAGCLAALSTQEGGRLAQVRLALKAVVDVIVKTVEAEKHLPDAVQVLRAVRIKNPLA